MKSGDSRCNPKLVESHSFSLMTCCRSESPSTTLLQSC